MDTLGLTAVDTLIESLVAGIEETGPRIVMAILVVLVAIVVVALVSRGLRFVLMRLYPIEEALVADLIVVIVSAFIWFGVALAVLSVLGLDEIAANMGTAIGFIALGISYALSEMIEDTVAGVYLLRDPNFNPGDRIVAKEVTGEVVSIGLRKSRFKTDDGDLAVVANRDVESRWTLAGGGDA